MTNKATFNNDPETNPFNIRSTGDVEKFIKAYDLRFFSDPGHGWLRVPRQLVKDLGIKDKISGYSYMNDLYLYLEEDSDIMAVLAFIPEQGRKAFMNFVPETYHEQTPVRNFQRFDPSKL